MGSRIVEYSTFNGELFSPERQIKMMQYIRRSRDRWKIFKTVCDEGFITPMELTKKVGLYQSNVSRVLGELCDIGVLVCINPNVHRGRVYCCTVNGDLVYRYMCMSELYPPQM